MAICVPIIILVLSKTVRKSKHTVSKTIICAQYRICVEIQDLGLHILKIISKIQSLDLHIFTNISKLIDLDLQFLRYFQKP